MLPSVPCLMDLYIFPQLSRSGVGVSCKITNAALYAGQHVQCTYNQASENSADLAESGCGFQDFFCKKSFTFKYSTLVNCTNLLNLKNIYPDSPMSNGDFTLPPPKPPTLTMYNCEWLEKRLSLYWKSYLIHVHNWNCKSMSRFAFAKVIFNSHFNPVISGYRLKFQPMLLNDYPKGPSIIQCSYIHV